MSFLTWARFAGFAVCLRVRIENPLESGALGGIASQRERLLVKGNGRLTRSNFFSAGATRLRVEDKKRRKKSNSF